MMGTKNLFSSAFLVGITLGFSTLAPMTPAAAVTMTYTDKASFQSAPTLAKRTGTDGIELDELYVSASAVPEPTVFSIVIVGVLRIGIIIRQRNHL